MNIFYLDKDPIQAALYHADKHVVKMILEYAQLLSTAHHLLDFQAAPKNIYKATHINHPSSKWVRQSINNYEWLYNLFCALCEEYSYRYGKVHLTDIKMRKLLFNSPKNIPIERFVQPPQAMPDDVKCSCSIDAYRKYYRVHKRHLAKWTKRQVPDWYGDTYAKN